MKGKLSGLYGVCLGLVLGCTKEPIVWEEISYRRTQLGDPAARSGIRSSGLPEPDVRTACIRSIQAVRSGADLFRVWWSARADSSVVLRVQRSDDAGATWLAPVSVDERDRGRRGCTRPPPGAYADSASGYLHIVYYIEGGEGAGIFFSHSMDRGTLFHAPVPVIYGKRPSRAAVAAEGDTVVVVFEDPNVTQARVGIALSTTAGHIFEQRMEVTPPGVTASEPWVALEGRKITVWWRSGDPVADRVGWRVGVRR